MNCCNRMNSSNKESSDPEKEDSVARRVRIEREYRICPSKLSKREIEDLYYKLLENNVELKKTVNLQEDKIKQMSVAMRRMSKENTERKKPLFINDKEKEKDCCSSTKTVINKQRESIIELRKENEQLAERIKQLNMKLCSAKQFLNRRPAVQSRCAKCAARPSTSGSRNLSSSTLPTKGSEVTVKNKSASYHKQCGQELSTTDDVKLTKKNESTETGDVVGKQKDGNESCGTTCEENRCKALMEELKLKISSLEDELAKTHEEYSGRMSRLEQEVLELQRQALRVRSDSARALRTSDRTAQARCDDLALQLSIEKSKVAELETQVKSASVSNQIAKTIEGQLANTIEGQLAKMSGPAVSPTAVSSIYTDQLKNTSSSPSPPSGPSAIDADTCCTLKDKPPPPSSRRTSLRTEKIPVDQTKGTASSSSASPPYTPIVMSRRVSADKTKTSPSVSRRRSLETGDQSVPDKTKSIAVMPVNEEKEKEDADTEKAQLSLNMKVVCECNKTDKKSKVKCVCPPDIGEVADKNKTDPCSTCYPVSEKVPSQTEPRGSRRLSKLFEKRRKSTDKSTKVICECNGPVKKSKSKVKCECPVEKELKLMDPGTSKDAENPCAECYATSNPENLYPFEFVTPQIAKSRELAEGNVRKSITPSVPSRVSDDRGVEGTGMPQDQSRSPGTIGPQTFGQTGPKTSNESEFPLNSRLVNESTSPWNSFDEQNFKIIIPTVKANRNTPSDDEKKISSVPLDQAKTDPLYELVPNVNTNGIAQQKQTLSNDPANITVPSRRSNDVTREATGEIGETVPIKRIDATVSIPVHELSTPSVSADRNSQAANADDRGNASNRRKSSTVSPVGTIEIKGIVDSLGRFSATPHVISEQLASNVATVSEEINNLPTTGKITSEAADTIPKEIDKTEPTKRKTSMLKSGAVARKSSSIPEPTYVQLQETPLAGSIPVNSEKSSTKPSSRTPLAGSSPVDSEKTASLKPEVTSRRISNQMASTTVKEESSSSKPGFTRKRVSQISKTGSLPTDSVETKSTPGVKRSSKLSGYKQSNVPVAEITGNNNMPSIPSERSNITPKGDKVLLNDAQIIDAIPINPSELSGIKQTIETIPVASESSDIPVPIDQIGDSIPKVTGQTNACPTCDVKTIAPPSEGHTSSSLPTSSAEDIIPESKPKKKLRDSFQKAQLIKKNASSLLLFDANHPKPIISGSTTSKNTYQEKTADDSDSKSYDKSDVANEEENILCDTCGKPVDLEENLPLQTPGKPAVQILPPNDELARTSKENVDGQQQPDAAPVDDSPLGKKPLDDSGYVEQKSTPDSSLLDNEDEQEKLNRELLEKISFLQQQLDHLKIAAAGESPPKSPPLESEVEIHSDPETDQSAQKRDSYADIVKNMNKIDHAMKQKDSLMPGRHEGRGKLDEANRRWVDYDLVSEDMLSDKTSLAPSDNRSIDKVNQEDRENRPNTSDNKYQIPGPIPTTATPIEKRKDWKERRTSRDTHRPKRNGERSSASFEHRESLQIGDPKKRRESKEKSRQEPVVPVVDQRKTDDPSREDLDKGTVYENADGTSLSRDVGIQTYCPIKTVEIDESSDFMPADFMDGSKTSSTVPGRETADGQKEEVELAMCEACTQVCRCRTGVKAATVLLRSCSGTLRVHATPGPNAKFKRCINCGGARVNGTVKVACPYRPPQPEPEDKQGSGLNTQSRFTADQSALQSQQNPFQITDHPDGCLNEHMQRICLDILARPETVDSNAKRKCGCSNERTCQSGICRPNRGTHISDTNVIGRNKGHVPLPAAQGNETMMGTLANGTVVGTQTNDRLNRFISGKYTKSSDETDFSSSAERSYNKESPNSWSHCESPPLSPGERRRRASPAADSNLSEGEVPTDSSRVHTKLVGDKQTETTYTLNAPTPSQKMAEMLQAISEEMTRCRQLLQTTRTSQQMPPKTHDVAASAVDTTSQISLRKADAKPRLGDVVTPKCIFTLHIGTVVLSDEAVINSSDMSLMLTWQFYDQNIAMTRMRAGRVVHFDFSTEYDVKLTDEFLEYLKHDEMPILICDVNKNDETFASCSLPLRDALLHTNRRADISLALVAGPRLKQSRAAADPLDAGDEVGVVDLWCMLRAEPRCLPLINRAIAKNTTVSQERSNSSGMRGSASIMPQLDENDQDEFHLSTDLDFTSRKTREPSIKMADIEALKIERANIPTHGKQDFKLPVAAPVRRSSLPQSLSWMSRDRDGRDEYSASRADIADNSKIQVSFEDNWRKNELENSGIIVNKVPANIKSTTEMQKALEKSTINIDPPKKNTELTNTPSMLSIGSRSFWKRKPKQRLSLSQDLDNSTNIQDLLNNRLPANSRITDATQIVQTTAEVSETALGKPKPRVKEEQGNSDSDIYNFLSKNSNYKVLDARKAMDVFRKVKIRNQTPRAVPAATTEESDRVVNRDWLQDQVIDITIQWIALNEECEAMNNPEVQRLYVAYSFLGKNGAELETPISLPKPKQYSEKCIFDFRKSFELSDHEFQALGRLARCRAPSKGPHNRKECVVFTVVSEPAEDPLAIHNCEDVGYAYLYFGDILAYSAGSDTYAEVLPIHGAEGGDVICGVLAVKVDGLDVVRKSLLT